jgi:Gpi18-like mannosyltransferase
LQLKCLYDKVPGMKLNPGIQHTQTDRVPHKQSEIGKLDSAWWALPWLPIIFITGLLVGLILLLSLPTRPILITASSSPDRDGNLDFSGVENHPDGYKFAWATAESALLFPDAPRYAPLQLTLRLNLQRPPGQPPADIKVIERPATQTEDATKVEGQGLERQIAELKFDPNRPGPQDYIINLPPRSHGDGAYLTFATNTFQPIGDRRELAFMFVQANLSMQPTHLRYLIWPHFYLPAAALFLAAVVAWCWRVGLGWTITTVFTGQLAYGLMMAAQSTWRITWLMLLISAALWATVFWGNLRKKAGELPILPLLAAVTLVVSLFLLTNDELKGDTVYYINWSRAIHQYGIWDIYSHEPSLNYLPLIVYLLWFYNLVAYPFGFQESILAWRIFASILFLGMVALLYLFGRENPRPAVAEEKSGPKISLPAMVLLVGFNISIFYNPTLWGQSDIIVSLLLVVCFYLIYRKHAYLAGFALAITVISKPQAWFVLPLAMLLLPKIVGWRKGILGLLPGFVVAAALALFAFGLNQASLYRYWTQGQLGGEYTYDFPAAYNLSYLLLDLRSQVPTWVAVLGFGLTGLTILLVAWRTFRGKLALADTTLGAALMNSACYVFLIKMKERYLAYALPLLGLGTYYRPALLKPFLALSWLNLINLSIIMFQSGRSRLQTLPENFYLWGGLLSQTWLRQLIAIGFIVIVGYMVWLYWRSPHKTPASTSGE